MTNTSNTTAQVVNEYYDILAAGMAAYDDGRRLRPILATDLKFEGPIAGHVLGAEPFVKGVAGFIDTVQSINIVHRLQADDMAATLYDAEMPGGTVRFAEFLHIQDGRIQSLKLVYDANEYTTRGGR